MVKKELTARKQAKLARKELKEKAKQSGHLAPNPIWFKPVMLGFMLLGLVWIVLYYITSATLALPVPQFGQWNIFVGFGFIMIGFLMTTRWR
ncbi:cell division protein CrgA [Canibacter sp. lx-72]|uniref:cell division protein CrgA n=1 Tax=Canibacter zhuwentaonis TaxID=2837491 RepID=UPI001BDDB238|nr:cell division protein CrgA [Canibacter zhuwentaonis]MBT1018658.1 cell division protein CrgA [Canibacter zhuwentaonis]MBT1035832.1 cell division protein CrgA [Canibacter zhuwentaonis]